jgi:hypothetical protein
MRSIVRVYGRGYNPAVNPWFERLRDELLRELGDDPGLAEALTLAGQDAEALLELAREAAHGSGARQFAPLATFLAGRLVQARGGDPAERVRLIRLVESAVRSAGPAGEERG